MAAGITRRLRLLEDAGGDWECPRCSGMVVVYLGGELLNANRDGKPMSKAEYLAHEAEDGPDGECPVCGERPVDIKVP